MSSLWSLVRKGKTQYVINRFAKPTVARILQQLSGEPPKLVNLDATDWWSDDNSQFDMDAMDATPCFQRMWFEWRDDETRAAVFVRRYSIGELADLVDIEALPKSPPRDARFLLEFVMVSEQDGAAIMRGMTSFFIDDCGRLADKFSILVSPEEQSHIAARALFVCDALTTINTKGTRIEPPFDSKPAQIVKPDRAPCSVWHTIHLPRFARPPLEEAQVSPEILERREHWVRAHRRDYRRGGGMFGRIKALVWVPEFQRGNPELGTVKQSYEVHRREPGRADDTERKALPPAKDA